jgi:hypothetical protein
MIIASSNACAVALSQLNQVMRLIHVLQPVLVLLEWIKAEWKPLLELASVDRPAMRAVDLATLRAACVHRAVLRRVVAEWLKGFGFLWHL